MIHNYQGKVFLLISFFIFGVIVLALNEQRFAVAGGLCAGHCGGQAPAGCYCDDQCFGEEDCCPDVCLDCPELEGCPTPTPTPIPIPPPSRLTVLTIPQEDQLREKGLMILGADIQGVCDTNNNECTRGLVGGTGCADDDEDDRCDFEADPDDRDLHAEYKMHVALDGVNVDPDTVTCWIVEKEICHIDGFCAEGLCFEGRIGESCITNADCDLPTPEGTQVIDVTSEFVCKFRKTKGKEGVGVLDVYYVGNPDELLFIGDHILKVQVTHGVFKGSEIQDICILDFPMCRMNNAETTLAEKDRCTDSSSSSRFYFPVDWQTGQSMNRYADAIGRGFASCKMAAFWQRHNPAGIEVFDCFFPPSSTVPPPF